MLGRRARHGVLGNLRMSRSSLLLRFSVLTLVLLVVIGAGLGWVLQRQMEQTALEQQAAEVAVVVNGVLSPRLALQISSPPPVPRLARAGRGWLVGS